MGTTICFRRNIYNSTNLSWENVTESGKHFVGWKSSLDEEIYTSAEICEREVKQDITYKAVFKTNQKYEVRIEYVYVDQSGKQSAGRSTICSGS